MHYKTRETRWDLPKSQAQATFGSPHAAKAKAAAQATAEARQRAAAPQRDEHQEQQQSGRGKPQHEPKSQPEPQKEVINTAGLESAEKAARIKQEISDDLGRTIKEDLSMRKKTFKLLCLTLHPVNNSDVDTELATQIFQFLQTQKDWYLKE